MTSAPAVSLLPTRKARRLGARLIDLAAGLWLAGAVHGTFRALHELALRLVDPTPGATLAGVVLRALGSAVVAALAFWVVAQRRGRGPGFVVAHLALYLAGGYGLSLAAAALGSAGLGGVATLPADTAGTSNGIAYRTNGFGLRGGAWSTDRPPGSVRAVIIGDSMVYGQGVNEADTLPVLLQERLRQERSPAAPPLEVLNLGIPGTNLAGHVRTLEAARRLARPDLAVVCLFLPNDFDPLEQPEESRRLGLFSFASFLFGSAYNPYTMLVMREAQRMPAAAQLARLRAHVADLATAAAGTPLFVFFYHQEKPSWLEVTREALAGRGTLLEHEPLPADSFIPGDGHPNAAGNGRIAALIAAGLLRSPLGALLRGTP